MTEGATAHRVAQLAALRVDTALDFAWEEVDEPPAADKRSLMTAAAIALEKPRKLVPPAARHPPPAALGRRGHFAVSASDRYGGAGS
ncbi:hypothetical protein ACFQ6S_17545 [Streptomyces sp. NPDC056479]|uniref:hypothetical protein n=1 Tax=Streptomyces sp. NPDC056479 TaxID=3345832 RepID=UPI0036CF3367